MKYKFLNDLVKDENLLSVCDKNLNTREIKSLGSSIIIGQDKTYMFFVENGILHTYSSLSDKNANEIKRISNVMAELQTLITFSDIKK